MRKFSGALAIVAVSGALIGGSLISGCSTTPKSEGDAVKLSANADATLAGYKAKDSSLQPLLSKSVGYAVFPDIGKGGGADA